MKIRLKLQFKKCYGIDREGVLQSGNCKGTILLNLLWSLFQILANEHLKIHGIGYQFIVNDNCLLCIFVVVKWNSEGCFNDHRRPAKRVFGIKFATIRGINIANPDIEKVFNICRVAAEQKGYKIFAIRVRRNSEMFFIPFFVSGLYVILSYRKLVQDDKGKFWLVSWVVCILQNGPLTN